jgi:hypothetical protein
MVSVCLASREWRHIRHKDSQYHEIERSASMAQKDKDNCSEIPYEGTFHCFSHPVYRPLLALDRLSCTVKRIIINQITSSFHELSWSLDFRGAWIVPSCTLGWEAVWEAKGGGLELVSSKMNFGSW